MKTVYFHIGTSKTGTSALQAFLEDNKDVLAEKGYFYERMPFQNLSRANIRRNAHFLVEKVMDENGSIDEAATEERIQKGYQILDGWLQVYEAVILTDESFWNGMIGDHWNVLERLKLFLDERNVVLKIIVYLRSQDEYMMSWWKQSVQSGKMTEAWDTFVEKPKGMRLNYRKQLKAFAEYVGAENMIVRRYDWGSFEGTTGTIFSDFLYAIGLEFTEEYQVREKKVNLSLTDNYAEIKRVLNSLTKEEAVAYKNERNLFEKVAIECSKLQQGDKSYSLYSAQEQEKIWKKYGKSNEVVRKTYFPNDKELFCNKLTEKEMWTKENPQMQEDIIRYFGMIALRQQQEMEQLQKKFYDSFQRQEVRIQKLDEKMQKQEARIQNQDAVIQQKSAQIQQLQAIFKQNKGELKALKIILKPIKWIWWKMNDIKKKFFGKDKTK